MLEGASGAIGQVIPVAVKRDWTISEVCELRAAIVAGKRPPEIADTIKRPVVDVMTKAEQLGLWGQVIRLRAFS